MKNKWLWPLNLKFLLIPLVFLSGHCFGIELTYDEFIKKVKPPLYIDDETGGFSIDMHAGASIGDWVEWVFGDKKITRFTLVAVAHDENDIFYALWKKDSYLPEDRDRYVFDNNHATRFILEGFKTGWDGSLQPRWKKETYSLRQKMHECEDMIVSEKNARDDGWIRMGKNGERIPLPEFSMNFPDGLKKCRFSSETLQIGDKQVDALVIHTNTIAEKARLDIYISETIPCYSMEPYIKQRIEHKGVVFNAEIINYFKQTSGK